MNFRSKRTRVAPEPTCKETQSSKHATPSLISSLQTKRTIASQPIIPSQPSKVAPTFGPFKPSKGATIYIPSLTSQASKAALKVGLSKQSQTSQLVTSQPSKTTSLIVQEMQSQSPRNEENGQVNEQREENNHVEVNHSQFESNLEFFEESEDEEENEHQNEDIPFRPPTKKKIYRPQVKFNWTDEISFDPDEAIEIEEVKDGQPPRRGTMSGTILARHVWILPPERRIIVPFNEYDQPIRKAGLVLVHYLSDIAKDDTYCPIGEISWKHVDKHYKTQIVDLVREKFVLPDGVKIDNRILAYVNKTWKYYRHELKRQYYRPNLTKEQIIENKPEGIIEQQWIKLASYWCSDRAKRLSKIGEKARASHAHAHTTGSRSIAQWKIEFEKIHKREPRSHLELWKFTHVTKGGGYIDNTSTQEFVDYADAEVAKRVRNSGDSLSNVEDEVFNDLMYSDGDSNKRVVGYGFGVTRNEVFGLEGELRKRYNGSYNGSSEMQGIKTRLISLEKKNAETISQLQKENAETIFQIQKQNAEIISQLQNENKELHKRNDILERQNEEVNRKNDQILSQLSRIMKKLDQSNKGS